MVLLHLALIVANTAIIVGGSFLAGANKSDPNSPRFNRALLISRIARTSGQSVFFAANVMLLFVIIATMRNNRRDGDSRNKKGGVHPTLVILFIAWFPLIVRGMFGVLQSGIWSLSYYNPENYRASGFAPHFTLIEYLLGVVTEWLSYGFFLEIFG
ncbi:hypothetical protein B0H11DRAFT_2255605 [Mycena galericulata]|nr:hypothetical protein B0H11DRAFT_2255605 [Mycena galericulata]